MNQIENVKEYLRKTKIWLEAKGLRLRIFWQNLTKKRVADFPKWFKEQSRLCLTFISLIVALIGFLILLVIVEVGVVVREWLAPRLEIGVNQIKFFLGPKINWMWVKLQPILKGLKGKLTLFLGKVKEKLGPVLSRLAIFYEESLSPSLFSFGRRIKIKAYNLKNRLARPGLRLKFVLGAANIVVLAIAVNSTFIFLDERRALRKEKELRATSILQNLMELNREALIMKDDITLETAAGRVVQTEADVVYVLILNAKKEKFFKTSLEEGETILERIAKLEAPGIEPKKQFLVLGKETLFDFSQSLVVRGKYLGEFHLGLSERGVNEVLKKARDKTLFISLFLLLIFLFLTLVLVTLAVKPIEQITKFARAIGGGDFESRIDLERKDEIGELASSMNWMVEEISRREKALLEKERIERDLEMAREMQMSLIPKEIPFIEGFLIGTIFSPARQVGGDYFDIFPVKDKFVMLVADVAGKGVAGALGTVMIRTATRTAAATIPEPSLVLSEVNNLAKRDLGAGRFVTMAYLLFDPQKGEVVLSSAGHNPPVFFNKDKVEFVELEGMALGVAPNERFKKIIEEKKLILAPGDGILLYTDGVTEAMKEEKPYGEDRLIEFLRRNYSLGAQEIVTALFHEIRAWSGEEEQDDDITAIVLKVK